MYGPHSRIAPYTYKRKNKQKAKDWIFRANLHGYATYSGGGIFNIERDENESSNGHWVGAKDGDLVKIVLNFEDSMMEGWLNGKKITTTYIQKMDEGGQKRLKYYPVIGTGAEATFVHHEIVWDHSL